MQHLWIIKRQIVVSSLNSCPFAYPRLVIYFDRRGPVDRWGVLTVNTPTFSHCSTLTVGSQMLYLEELYHFN